MGEIREIHATTWKDVVESKPTDKYGFKKMLSQLIEEHPEILEKTINSKELRTDSK